MSSQPTPPVPPSPPPTPLPSSLPSQSSLQHTTSSSAGRRFINKLQGAFMEAASAATGSSSSSSSASSSAGGGGGPPTSTNANIITSSVAAADPGRTLIVHTVDKKRLDSTYHLLDKVIQLCRQPKLNLKVSPPYLPDILYDIRKHLALIVSRSWEVLLSESGGALLASAPAPPSSSTNNNDDSVLWRTLNDSTYFCVFVDTVRDKCKYALKLFREGKERIFDSQSAFRVKLVKLSLVFSHMHKDVEAIYPEGVHHLGHFAITKPDAAQWWRQHFATRPLVTWQEFRQCLFHTHRVAEEPREALALQKTLDLTCNYYISVFEFDVFVRLFQPWENILETWKALAVTHPAYMAFMTYDEVKQILTQFLRHPGAGTYVYRQSCTKLGQWAIGYITQEGAILQTIIQNKSLAQALLDGEKEGFYRYPNGLTPQAWAQLQLAVDLDALVHRLPSVHIAVSREQYEVYCEIGSTFQLCKICAARDKNVRVEPCGHLLCRACLLHWQGTKCEDSHLCPFCRQVIKGVEEVTVIPHAPPSSSSVTSQVASGGGGGGSGESSMPDLIVFDEDEEEAAAVAEEEVEEEQQQVVPQRPPRCNAPKLHHPAQQPPLVVSRQLSVSSSAGEAAAAVMLDASDAVSDVRRLCDLFAISGNAAGKLLSITRQDVGMAEEILKYFHPKPGL